MALYRQYYCVICKNHAHYPSDTRTKYYCGHCYKVDCFVHVDKGLSPIRKSVPKKKASIKKRKTFPALNKRLFDPDFEP